MGEPSDRELIARLREDPASLDIFYRRHVAALERYAVRRCPQAADVADLVAATFLAVLDGAPSYDERRGTAVSWLLGVAHLYWHALSPSASTSRPLPPGSKAYGQSRPGTSSAWRRRSMRPGS